LITTRKDQSRLRWFFHTAAEDVHCHDLSNEPIARIGIILECRIASAHPVTLLKEKRPRSGAFGLLDAHRAAVALLRFWAGEKLRQEPCSLGEVWIVQV
jgi:hypothetical protein